MTQEEQKRYDQLSPREQETYNFYSKRNPGWTQSQLLTMCGFEDIVVETIEDGPGNVRIDDPKVQKGIFERLDGWFNKTFPELYIQVAPIMQKAIYKLTVWIEQGIKVVKNIFDLLKELFR